MGERETRASPEGERAFFVTRAAWRGLLGMKERVALLGGSLEIDSRPGSGTRVRAVVPLKEREVGDG